MCCFLSKEAAECLDELDYMFGRERAEREAWDEILHRTEQIMKLRSEERKRRMDMKNLLNAEQAMDMTARLLAAVNEGLESVIDDEDTRKQVYLSIGQRFARITGSGDPTVLASVRSGTVELARPSRLD